MSVVTTRRWRHEYVNAGAPIGWTQTARTRRLTQIGSLYPDLVAARPRRYAVVDATPSVLAAGAGQGIHQLVP